MQEIGTMAWGRDEAPHHKQFVGAYHIVENERGRTVEGTFPDGRMEFMCTRCLKALKHVYVFANSTQRSFMHVGMDCAEKMGIPRAELDKAENFFRDLNRAANRAANAQRIEAERVAAAERKAQNLAACHALVSDIASLLNHPACTDYERHEVLRPALELCAEDPNWYNPEWLIDHLEEHSSGSHRAPLSRATKLSAGLDSVRDRLALCNTSKPVKPVKGKAITGAFRAYRRHININTGFGDVSISFLTDDCGNAFVVKSAEFWVRHGCTVIGTFSIGESDERDGLVSTRLLRPRKIDPNCDNGDQWHYWSVGRLSDRHLARKPT